MNKYILVLNAGSATLKFKFFQYRSLSTEVIAGNFERIGLPDSFLFFGKEQWNFPKISNHVGALKIILDKLGDKKKNIHVVGHRVVHGGEKFFKSTVVSKKVWQQIAKYNELAPLHNPTNLKVIKACYKLLPKVKNVAVFDTAFYANLKPNNYLYALPYELYKRYGIRKYGFHGISHKYVASQAAIRLKKPVSQVNIISAHLGNGCSVTAIRKGKPVATSMGFTPLGGLVMGTRCGDIDPALPLFIQKKLKLTPDQVEKLLNRKSGLLGLSGFSSDMREILKAAGYRVTDYHGRTRFNYQQKKRAKLALEIFINRLRCYLTLYAGLLGRVDGIVFTGGIGERSPVIRQLAVKGLTIIKRPKVFAISTNEEFAIAKQVKSVV